MVSTTILQEQSALVGSVGSSTSPALPSPRLVNAAHEFEAALMKELMAPLMPGHDVLGGDDAGEGSNSALSEFAGEAFSKAISEHGGLGIASSILRQLSSPGNRSGNSVVGSQLSRIHPKSPS